MSRARSARRRAAWCSALLGGKSSAASLIHAEAAAGVGGDNVVDRFLVERAEPPQVLQDQTPGVLLIAVVAMQGAAANLPLRNLHDESGPSQERGCRPVRFGKQPFLRAAEEQRRLRRGTRCL